MNKNIDILLVEDNLADIGLIKEAFKYFSVKYSLHIVHDGIEALSFLRKEEKYSDAPEPYLVFLDLNMPKKNGYEVLEEVKSDKQLKHIPIIILSTSEKEVMKAYDCCANSYLKKPMDFNDFVDMVKSVESFWLRNAVLPLS